MRIKQFRYAADNLGYLVYTDKNAIAIDGGAPEEMISFAKDREVVISDVANTHFHHDHTTGNKALLDKTGARFLDCRKVRSDRELHLDGQVLQVIPTPGHTSDSITFLAEDFMVTGDTLFNGTVGNCFSGDLDAFYHSLKRLISLPLSTQIWAGHDYVLESMQIAKQIEPDNKDIEKFLNGYDPEKVVSTVADELNINPYIRFNAPEMINRLNEKKMPTHTELDRFKSVMTLY